MTALPSFHLKYFQKHNLVYFKALSEKDCDQVSVCGEGFKLLIVHIQNNNKFELLTYTHSMHSLTHTNAHSHTHRHTNTFTNLSVTCSLFSTTGTLQCLSDHLASALLDIVTAKGNQLGSSFRPILSN